MEKKEAYLTIARPVLHLQLSGFYQLNKTKSNTLRSCHNYYMRFILCFFLLYILQQIIKIYEVRNNVDQVMGTMFLLLTNTDCIYKDVILWKKADKIEEVLTVMKGAIFNQGEPEHLRLQGETLRKGLTVSRVFINSCMFTCFLWVLHPTILHIQGKPVEFPVWLPFDPNSDPEYYIAVIYVWIQTTWLAFSNTTTDVFIAFTLEQCRTQVSILRVDLENVVQKSKDEAITSPFSYPDILERRFNKMLLHHNEIVKTADKIQDIFGGAVLYQFMLGGWILCTSAYRMVNASLATVEFISMVMYIICISVQIFLYCFYGNELTHESLQLTDSAYAIDWLKVPIKQRKSLIIFMERCKVPIRPMAGFLLPLSNSTFVSILRSSYSFYAFLKNSDH